MRYLIGKFVITVGAGFISIGMRILSHGKSGVRNIGFSWEPVEK